MSETLRKLLDQVRAAGATGKGAAIAIALATLGVLGAAALVVSEPEWTEVASHLDDQERSAVLKALSEAGIPFQVSQPPGPYFVLVDHGDRMKALSAIFTAGALEHSPGGITTDLGGVSTVFMSSGERQQAIRKREWQETEALLEELDFVVKARVGTHHEDGSLVRRTTPVTASVTLTLRDGRDLSPGQARTVAQLVRFRLGVEPENLVISDQDGNSLFDGGDGTDPSAVASGWHETQRRHDMELSDRATELLDSILGAGKARVTVTSSWDTDRVTETSETSDPESRVVVSEEKQSSRTPVTADASVGGPAGTASNLAPDGFGVDNAGVSGAGAGGGVATAAVDVPEAKDETTRKAYIADRVQRTQVRTTPVLERLSVSLFLDESIAAEKLDALAMSVKAAVGFVPARDSFESMQIAFQTPEPKPLAEPTGLESDVVQKLIERGVEILAAAAFLFLLVRTLRGARKKATEETPATADEAAEEAEEPLDPDEILRRQVDELVSERPEQVGRILSAWARDTRKVGTGR